MSIYENTVLPSLLWARKIQLEEAKINAVVNPNFGTLRALKTAKDEMRYTFAKHYGWNEAEIVYGPMDFEADDNSGDYAIHHD